MTRNFVQNPGAARGSFIYATLLSKSGIFVLERHAMSWEYFKYEVVCGECGKTGFRIDGSNDWGQSETRWEGFENLPPNWYEVGRKKVGADDMRPRCTCGSTKIIVGKLVQTY